MYTLCCNEGSSVRALGLAHVHHYAPCCMSVRLTELRTANTGTSILGKFRSSSPIC
ncbi:hypothetical protein E2C01_092780 [Portunus trituberculatus]|uniref:Uncharacterized protein n=1 Tax=Portunus trituberculatus TaxID=210409 RepID=A0A5B7JST2_PORTR|nr:hypothetical protein [Portunus trituberculatus]